jgi:hypothetical protein
VATTTKTTQAAEPDAQAVEHVHAKAGGGTYKHSHPVSGTKAHGHVVDAKDNGSNSELLPTVAAMSETSPGVMALRFPQQAKLSEGAPIDYMCTGEWTFPELNHGRPITVTRDDLVDLKALFDANAYGQNLPIIDETHDKNRAVGWIKTLDWHPSDPERLVAVPEWNEGTDKLVANNEYAHTSPVLLLNWRDPVSGTVYPVVPGGLGLDPNDPDGDTSGLALTNHPKIKRLSAKFAASESGDTQAALIALGEVGTVFSGVAADTARALFAEGDGAAIDFAAADASADMADLPPCSWAPPYAEYNRCPGYTRVLADGDGDAPGDLPGCCRLAAQCNGYSPVPTGTVPPYQRSYYSEGTHMADNPAQPAGAPANPAPVPNAPQTDPPAAPQPPPAPPPPTTPGQPTTAAQHSADMGEMQRMLAAETFQRETMQTEVARLGEELKRRDEDDKIRSVTVRLSELAKRFPPAVLDSLAGSAKNGVRDRTRLLRLSEHPVGIEALEAIPQVRGGAVSLSELGTGAEADPETSYSRLRKFAEDLRTADPKLSREQAMLKASEQHPDLVAAYRAEKNVPPAAG